MCVIIHKPEGVVLAPDKLLNCWQNNPHGWGVMFEDRGRVVVEKSLEYSDFEKLYDQIKDRQIGIHFRYRTHGDINADQCHPYMVLNHDDHGSDIWMMHNGVIHKASYERDRTKSDTWHFIDETLRPIVSKSPKLLLEPAFLKLVADYVGSSRLLFLNSDGLFSRIGGGDIREGCWFSNPSALMPRFRETQTTTQGVYRSKTWTGWSGDGYGYDYEGYPRGPGVGFSGHGRNYPATPNKYGSVSLEEPKETKGASSENSAVVAGLSAVDEGKKVDRTTSINTLIKEVDKAIIKAETALAEKGGRGEKPRDTFPNGGTSESPVLRAEDTSQGKAPTENDGQDIVLNEIVGYDHKDITITIGDLAFKQRHPSEVVWDANHQQTTFMSVVEHVYDRFRSWIVDLSDETLLGYDKEGNPIRANEVAFGEVDESDIVYGPDWTTHGVDMTELSWADIHDLDRDELASLIQAFPGEFADFLKSEVTFRG